MKKSAEREWNKKEEYPKAKEAGFKEEKLKNNDPEVKEKISGWQRIRDDFKDKRFLPLKLLFVVIASSIGVLLPYMTIHMKSLGITIEESAIIYGIFPIFGILAPPAMGFIADKIGNFKFFVSGMLVVCAATALLFLAIPPARFVENHPKNLSLSLGCYDDQEFMALQGVNSSECKLVHQLPTNMTFDLGTCSFRHSSNDSSACTEASSFSVRNWTLEISPCENSRVDCVRFSDFHSLPTARRTFKINELELVNNNSLLLKSFLMDGQLHSKVKCIKADQWERSFASLTSPFTEECQAVCPITIPRKAICSNTQTVTVYDPTFTFWTYLMLRIGFTITFGGSMVLFEGAVIAIITEYKGDLGLQRLYGVIGLTIFSPLSGFLIDSVTADPDYPDFRPAFFMFAALLICGAIMIMTVTLDFKPPSEKLMADVRSVLANAELDVFLVIAFLSGAYWGYIESYLFWFLEDMGGTKSLMGLTLAVSALSGIPCLILASPIAKKIGHPNIQVIGFAFYVIRFIGYSYIYEPYTCLIFETMEAVTTALMSTSAISYSAELSKTSTLATIQGLVSGIYHGIGRGAGSLLGGYFMKWVGTRTTFRLMGVAAFVTGVAYFLFNIFYLRPKHAAARKSAHKVPDVNHKNTSAFSENVTISGPNATLKKTAIDLGEINRGYAAEETVEEGMPYLPDSIENRLQKDIINTLIDQEAKLHTNDQLRY